MRERRGKRREEERRRERKRRREEKEDRERGASTNLVSLNFSEKRVENPITPLPPRPKHRLALVKEQHGVGHVRLAKQTPEIGICVAAFVAPAREGGEIDHQHLLAQLPGDGIDSHCFACPTLAAQQHDE